MERMSNIRHLVMRCYIWHFCGCESGYYTQLQLDIKDYFHYGPLWEIMSFTVIGFPALSHNCQMHANEGYHMENRCDYKHKINKFSTSTGISKDRRDLDHDISNISVGFH